MLTEFRQFIHYFLCFIIMLPIILMTGCQSGDPVGLRDVVEGSNNLITGEFEDVVTKTIDAGGGTIKVDALDDPMNGFEISVPPNSFADARTFEVTRAEIKSHNMGAYFNPISPLIKISNGGGYANEVMEVKVPVKVPAGYFAMGFFYDEKTGTLEGLPLLALDSTSVTIGTRHFSTSNLSGNPQQALFKRSALPSYCDLIINAIDLTMLQGKDIISTDYELREDNWEFNNYGSYLSTGGICAGMSLTSIWYYYERRLRGDHALYSLFDDVDQIWQDNPKGIRFASTVQDDYEKHSKQLENLYDKIAINHDYDYLGWRAFAFSLLTTGEPQIVGMFSRNGGHMIVAYSISLAQGTLDVADPNFPDELRAIQYENEQFQPYSTRLSLNDIDDDSFTKIGYYAKTALIDWGTIGEQWEKLQNNTVGNDRFPEYSLWVMDSDIGQELGDRYTTGLDSLIVQTRCPSAEVKVTWKGIDFIGHEIYDEEGNRLASTAWGFFKPNSYAYSNGVNTSNAVQTAIKLNPGLNHLGFHIYGWRNNNYYPETTSYEPTWIDFRWVDVICEKFEIQSGESNGAPILTAGEPYKALKFVALFKGYAPKQSKYVWDFGDGTPLATAYDDSTMQHTFYAMGSYTVTVTLFDNAANKQVGSAKVDVKIGTDNLDLMHKCKGVRIDFHGLGNFKVNDGNASQQEINDTFLNLEGMQNIYRDAPALSWSGTSFSVEFSKVYASPYFPDELYDCKLTISGSVSSDGNSITNLSATEDRILQSDSRDKVHRKIEIQSLPLTAQSLPSDELNFIYDAEDDQVNQFISGYEYVSATVQESGAVVSTQTCVSLDWSTPLSGGPRQVIVSFSEKKE
jgi:hypothetical protein